MVNVQYLLEPCCIQRQLSDLCRAIKDGGEAEFNYYGDLSLTELLPALLERYNKTRLLIVAPSIPDTAAEVIASWARRQWKRMDGSGSFYALQHITIVTSLAASPAVGSWLEKNLFGDRLTVVDANQGEHIIALHNLAISGFRNMRYGENGTAVITTEPEKIESLWEKYEALGFAASLVEEGERSALPLGLSKTAPAPTVDDSSSSDDDGDNIELIRIID